MQLTSTRIRQQVVCSYSRPHAHRTRHPTKHWSRPKVKDTPLNSFLRSSLAIKDQVVRGTLALCPALTDFCNEEIAPTLSLLFSIASKEEVRSVVLRNPGLLAVPLQAWHDFFTVFGMDDTQFWQLLCRSPSLFLHGSVFQAGSVIMFLQAHGWTDLEINSIIIPHHTTLLQMDVDSQLRPVLHHLQHDRAMTPAEACAFLHQYPQVLYTQDYKAATQQLMRKQRLLQLQCL